MNPAAPTLADLQAALDRAERQLVSDEMIDNWPRQQREVAKSKARVAELKTQIARMEESF